MVAFLGEANINVHIFFMNIIGMSGEQSQWKNFLNVGIKKKIK